MSRLTPFVLVAVAASDRVSRKGPPLVVLMMLGMLLTHVRKAVLLLLLLALPLLPRASAAACFDPIPDPTTSGWTPEGEGTFQPGARLIVVDPGLGGNDFKTFRCADPPMFQEDVVLTPRLAVDAGFTANSSSNLGIHVTINDGASQFRVVLFREGVGSLRVKVALPGNEFSPGFAFFGLAVDFTMSRLSNGSMVLAVANPTVGAPPLTEVYNLGDVPQTDVQNLEFGTYNVPTTATTTWETLGLPPMAGITLDPNNPEANFEKDGNQVAAPGNALLLTDSNNTDHIGFFAVDPGATTGEDVDVAASFQVLNNTTPAGVDVGLRVIITDGVTSAIAACVTLGGVPGIGIAIGTDFNSGGNYGAFVQVDWLAPVSLRFRRTATGDAEIIEVNGVPPSPRAIVPAVALPGAVRATPSVGFGLFSDSAVTTAAFNQFSSLVVAQAVAGSVSFTAFRIHDTDSTDRLRFRADYELGANTNGIDPATEQVTVTLSNGAGEFYSQTLNGFTVGGQAPRRRWSLNQAERTRTGIERFEIDEDPNNTGAVFLRDVRFEGGTGEFDTVDAEIVIGTGSAADEIIGRANLVQRPAGSGRWRLSNEP
jgi:hypothetical protein